MIWLKRLVGPPARALTIVVEEAGKEIGNKHAGLS
jgi:hypothetical protein